jgi:hypothetical protein
VGRATLSNGDTVTFADVTYTVVEVAGKKPQAASPARGSQMVSMRGSQSVRGSQVVKVRTTPPDTHRERERKETPLSQNTAVSVAPC